MAAKWSVGDRVCFAHMPDGTVFTVNSVCPPNIASTSFMVELSGMCGLFAEHLFVRANTEGPKTLTDTTL